ncbi:Crp/Fnr family transcriptional regulator [Novosphingobium sp. KACC 22771]|uniref:Crp/Fnr family transcriptional regulator n=1 Tax=Novosphingobium sp. KACC 22771 TaxID=3025670 RepID=UPI0023670359|nr:Crp/Fnr family transcriptional regulator [Novosphingobium sp. KACC 22771]WDF74037.1 Crp/Fnr family transcriptional regulator [Novosphingobium sp. KACC 22771]
MVLTTQSPPRTRHAIRRHDYLARRHEAMDRLFRVESGWACQYRLLPDGRRQIITLFLPGDYCEAQWALTGRANWPVTALTDMLVTPMALSEFRGSGPGATEGMTSLMASITQTLKSHENWIVNLGRMNATERICALLCDLVERLRPSGSVVDDQCVMPLTQADFADIVGISAIHANRVIQTLRGEGVIALEAGQLKLLDPAELLRRSGPAHD